MLAANEAVARHFTQRGSPTLYRIHASPDEEKLEAFATLARAHGVDVPFGALTPLALNEILKKVSKLPQQRAFNSLLLRAMMQASYHRTTSATTAWRPRSTCTSRLRFDAIPTWWSIGCSSRPGPRASRR